MSDKKDGGAAFPFHVTFTGPMTNPLTGEEIQSGSKALHGAIGISARDYFATSALQGMLGNTSYLESMMKSNSDKVRSEGAKQVIAMSAYEFADAMLAERAK